MRGRRARYTPDLAARLKARRPWTARSAAKRGKRLRTGGSNWSQSQASSHEDQGKASAADAPKILVYTASQSHCISRTQGGLALPDTVGCGSETEASRPSY